MPEAALRDGRSDGKRGQSLHAKALALTGVIARVRSVGLCLERCLDSCLDSN